MQKAKKPQSLPTPHQKPQQFLKHQSNPKVTPKHRQNKVKFFKPKSTFKFHSKVIRPFCCLAGAAASLRVSSIMSPTPLYTHSCFGSSATMLLFDFEMAMQDLNLTSFVLTLTLLISARGDLARTNGYARMLIALVSSFFVWFSSMLQHKEQLDVGVYTF